jgi:trimeric autotransporter adhesin
MNHTTDLHPSATVASILIIIVVGTVLSWLPAQAQVGTNAIDNGAVTSPKIRDRQVKTPDIEDDAITSDKIRVGAVGNAAIADNSITSEKILDGSITSDDLATGSGFSGDAQEQVSQIIFSTCSIDFDAVAANKVKTAFCPVPGAKIGDHIIVTNQDLSLGLVTQSATVNATELVRIAVTNPSTSAVDPPSSTWALIVFRS